MGTKALQKDLEQDLSAMARVMPVRPGRRYGSMAEIILKEGPAFSTEPYTGQEKKVLLKAFCRQSGSKVKQCYFNAQSLALYTDLEYAEGFVMVGSIPLAIEHAWNFLPSGKVVDVTLRNSGENETYDPKKILLRAEKNLKNAYMGVPFEAVDIRASWFRNKASLMLLMDPVIQEVIMREGFQHLRGPSMSGLRDMDLPADIPRPEMWTTAAIVQAVQEGFTFLVPFVLGESLFSKNAYWIGGRQASAFGFTVGPEHTPEIRLIEPDAWIQAKTYFRPEMVPKSAWLEPPNVNGVVPVHVEIDPETVDWDLLNRGRQIQGSF